MRARSLVLLGIAFLALFWWVLSEGDVVSSPVAELERAQQIAAPEPTLPAPLGSEQPERLDEVEGRTALEIGAAPAAGAVDERASLSVRVLQTVDGVRWPVAEAFVEISTTLDENSDDEPKRAVRRADANGALEVQVTPGFVSVAAWLSSGSSEISRLRVLRRQLYELELELEPRATLQGEVVDALTGAPIAGARVSSMFSARADVAITDALGRYEHPRIPMGDSYSGVSAVAAGYGDEMVYFRIQESGRWSLGAVSDTDAGQDGLPAPARVDFELMPDVVYTGRVLDPEGGPVSDAKVAGMGYLAVPFGAAGGPLLGTPDRADTDTGIDGRFRLGGLRGDIGHELTIDAAGFALRALSPRTTPGSVDLGDIQLSKEARLVVLVEDASGRPAEGLTVKLIGDRELIRDPADGPPQLEPVSERQFSMSRSGFDRTSRTDSRGEARFASLPSGELRLEIFWGRFSRMSGWNSKLATMSQVVTIEATELELSEHVRLPPEYQTLLGRLLDGRDGGAAVPGASVALWSHTSELGTVTTDANGVFRIAGLPASHEIFLRADRVDEHGVLSSARLGTTADSSQEPVLILEPATSEDDPR